jgi:hypothetical protein
MQSNLSPIQQARAADHVARVNASTLNAIEKTLLKKEVRTSLTLSSMEAFAVQAGG